MRPKIVKSTPRNLGCGFHKPPTITSYDLNPNLLEKWGQILQDRHEARMASKGTLTLEAEGSEATSGRLEMESEVTRMELVPASSSPPTSLRPMDYLESGELPDSGLEGNNAESSPSWHMVAEQGNVPRYDSSDSFSTHIGSKQSKGLVSSGSGSYDSSSQTQQGKKRQHKTKHTAASKIKRPKWNPVENPGTTAQISVTNTQQEEVDRKVAVKLQRRFDLERTAVNRQKGSQDGYSLRTKNNFRAK
ncbi:hypothetical protein scyTo_0025404 [Scyliorhinus torazame]|uniref:RING-type E3 ubiquitin transferase n=2 Tax=Scyliorhinus torazame TaxID=75743 RepID=A0A401QHE9_SCYTO|nr:hypothetical protein [Scyliorhinus torazame]